MEQAMARFLGRGPQRLSELSALQGGELDTLLDLLDEVLNSPPARGGEREVRTADGRMTVRLVPPGQGKRATLTTPDGRLRCADYSLCVEPSTGRAGGRHQQESG